MAAVSAVFWQVGCATSWVPLRVRSPCPVLAPSWRPLGSPYMSSTVVPAVLVSGTYKPAPSKPHVHMRLLCANGPLASIHKQHAHKSVWYCGSVAGAAVVWQVGCATLGFLCGSGRLVRYWHRRGVLGFPLHAMPLAERVLFPHQDPHELQVYRPWVCNLVPKPQASS